MGTSVKTPDGLSPSQDLHLRIAAIFILLITSALGAVIPILAKNRHDSMSAKSRATSWAPFLLDFSKYLGSGVIIGTAFVHLLSPAFQELSDPSLPEAWQSYDWAPVITMAAVFGIFTTELLAFRLGTSWLQKLGIGYDSHGHVHSSHGPCEGEEEGTSEADVQQPAQNGSSDQSYPANVTGTIYAEPTTTDTSPLLHKALAKRANVRTDSERKQVHSWKQRQRSYGTLDGKPGRMDGNSRTPRDSFEDSYAHHHHSEFENGSAAGESESGANGQKTGQQSAGQIIGVAILEFGVLLHSFIIGLTLAVQERFVTLFVVIVLHQSFEGLGLGSRLAALSLPTRLRWVPTFAAFLFSAITPIGLGIGLLLRKTYDPNSPTSLIVSGVLDSLSAGVLLYTGLVELLCAEFLFHQEMRDASLPRVLYALACVLLGATIMAVLGIWA